MMKNKILILMCLVGVFYSCNLFRSKENKRNHVNKNKPNSKTTISTKIVKPDTIYVFSQSEYARQTDSVTSDVISASEDYKALDSVVGLVIHNRLAAELGEAKSDLQERIKYNSNELETLNNTINELNKFYQVDNAWKVREEIGKEEYEDFLSKNPNRKLDSNDINQIIKNANNRIISLFRENDRKLLQATKRVKVLIQERETIAYEVLILESNTRFSDVMWNINNNTHFKSGSANLSVEDSLSIYTDYSRFFDSIFSRIQQINHLVYGNQNHPQKFMLKIFVDGYSDSKKFKHKSVEQSKILNNKLSEDRAIKIRNIFLTVFNHKKDKMKDANILFSTPAIILKGHGTEKPDIKVQFKKEGEEDINRRLTMIHCRFFPVK